MKLRNCLWVFCVFVTLVLLAGCPIAAPEPIRVRLEGVRDGTRTGLGDGWARTSEFLAYYGHLTDGQYGERVSVTVTVEDGYITDVVVYRGNDSTIFIEPLIDRMIPVVKARNTFDLALVDVGGGATASFRGIVEGGNNAIDQLRD